MDWCSTASSLDSVSESSIYSVKHCSNSWPKKDRNGMVFIPPNTCMQNSYGNVDAVSNILWNSQHILLRKDGLQSSQWLILSTWQRMENIFWLLVYGEVYKYGDADQQIQHILSGVSLVLRALSVDVYAYIYRHVHTQTHTHIKWPIFYQWLLFKKRKLISVSIVRAHLQSTEILNDELWMSVPEGAEMTAIRSVQS